MSASRKSPLACLQIAALLLFCFPAHAQKPSEPAPSVRPVNAGSEGRLDMNGIKFSDYAGFAEKWKLVTVRYRTDTGEQRFVYANDLAYEGLVKNTVDYPDGSVLAKMVIYTNEDPDFISSRIPIATLRMQFMVRNNKKYASTDGWGYALFDMIGRPTPANGQTDEQMGQTCNACHQVVKKRGLVFSKPIDLVDLSKGSQKLVASLAAPPSPNRMNSLRFKDIDTLSLAQNVRDLLPPGTDKVRSLEGAIRNHYFPGTLNEIMPILTHEVERTSKPAIFLGNASDKDKTFELVQLASGAGKAALDSTDADKTTLVPCAEGMKKYLVISRYENLSTGANPPPLSKILVCR
jgi:Cytochrome P460